MKPKPCNVQWLAGLGILCCSILAGGQSPATQTAEQQEKLQQRKQLLAEAQQLHTAGQLARAIVSAEKVLALDRELFGPGHRTVADTLRFLGRLHEAREDFAASRQVRSEAVALLTRLLGKDHWEVTDARLELADGERLKELSPAERQQLQRVTALEQRVIQMYGQGRCREALPLAREVVAVRQKVLGENSRAHVSSLGNLALLYKEVGEDYPKALVLSLRALDLTRNVLGENHPDFATVLNNLALLYQDMGEYARALPLSLRALDLTGKVQGESSPDYATSLNNLAALYRDRGEYARALPLFQKALALRKKVLGVNHPDYAMSLNNLATVYKARGDYARALSLYQQACDRYKKVLGEDHPDYAISLNNLAALYLAMGDYPRALPLLQQALDLTRKAAGESSPAYATSLNNLALLYKATDDAARALPLLQQALDLRYKVLGKDHPLYAQSLSNLASLYQARRDYTRALPLFEQALELRKKVLGENHTDYAHSLTNLAALYRDKREYARALPLFQQALELRKKLLGESSPDYARTLNDLALLYQSLGDHSTAQRLGRQALDLSLHLLEESFDAVGERQRLERLNELYPFLNNFLVSARHTGLPAREVYAAILKWKGAVTCRQADDLLGRDQPALAPLLQSLHSVKEQLGKAAFETPAPAQREAWLRRLAQLRDDKEQLEQQLASASRAFRNLRRPAPSPEQVRDALPRGSALVDWVVYRTVVPLDKRQANKTEWDNHLVTFVVRPDQDVRVLFADDLQAVETQIESWRQAVLGKNAEAQARTADLLHQQLWQPLQEHLGSANTVLLCPDGPLTRFPFAALPGKKPGSFLIEDLAIGYIASGRQLVDLMQPADNALVPPAGLLALGGVAYGEPGGRTRAFVSLPGTSLEAVRVRDQFRARFADERATLLLAEQPSRARVLEEVARRYRYLHLATHGFFDSPARLAALQAGLRTSEGGLSPEQRAQRDDLLAFLPLLRSGLVLAGANRSEGEEAFLTADDLAGLDLRGTELVVLSACETSLGKLTQGDGVLGLQRGFHTSGARTLVASLWSVNDAATSVLMEQFYANLSRKDKPLSKLEALRQAQLFVLKGPDRVAERRRDLRAEVARRGLPAEGLRGPKGDAVLMSEGKTEPGQRRSPVAWWAAFVLSGKP